MCFQSFLLEMMREDLRNLALDSYQLKQMRSYYVEYVCLDGHYKVRLCNAHGVAFCRPTIRNISGRGERSFRIRGRILWENTVLDNNTIRSI